MSGQICSGPISCIEIQHVYCSVADTERFDADPDPTFYVDADPDPTLYVDADSDPKFEFYLQ